MSNKDKVPVTVYVDPDVYTGHLQQMVDRAFEPTNTVASSDDDKAQHDFTKFTEVEPLLLDVVAMLQLSSMIDAAAESYEGVTLLPRHVRVLHRGMNADNNLNRLEQLLQGFHNEFLGKAYDHKQYDDGGVWTESDAPGGTP